MCWHFHQNLSMLIWKQEFLSVKVRKKSKYPITFKFVLISNGAQLSAEECWFLPYLRQHLTSQHWSYHNQKCRLSKIYHPETPVPSFILVLFKIKFSIIIKQEFNTWNIKLVFTYSLPFNENAFMENLEKTMLMFVCLAEYLDVLAFLPKFVNADLKAGIFICES